jgi:SAM-dependent methyltransferase
MALFDLMASHRITAVVYVAVRLGVADCLAEGPKTTREVADRTDAHQQSLQRLLRALITIGICKPVGADQFELTSMGKHLAGSAEQSLKAWALFEGELLSRSWSGLLDSIRTGKTAAELAGIDDPFDLMAQDPERVKVFNEAMAALTRHVVPAVLSAYDFSPIGRLIDVGGGYGELLCAILKAYPSMRGAIYDLRRCADGANRHLSEAGLSERGEFISGSFFESVPAGADAVIMKSIIHDWDDARSITILQNCRRALTERGRLLLVERIMPEIPEVDTEHRSVALSDLNMLRGPGGAERTEREYRELASKARFKVTRVLAAGRSNIIEAMAG